MDYIANPADYEKEILNGYKMDVVNYGYELDKFCPAKLGQLTCIVGHTNIGKTTVQLWNLARLARQGKKVLIYSAENRISNLHNQFVRFINEKQVTREHLEDARNMVRFIKHERRFSYKDMLNQATFLLDAGFDWDFFFIDPYNSLRIDNSQKINTHDYHYEAIEEMRIFTIATNKSIFLNCHTVTEAQRVKADVNGCKPVPQMSDVEGGAKFPNKADDVMVFHRQLQAVNENERYVTEIHVGKVRNKEFGGEPTGFDKPVRLRYRKDWTGFDIDGSYESKIHDYKKIPMNYNPF